jgi:hypothetical protein
VIRPGIQQSRARGPRSARGMGPLRTPWPALMSSLEFVLRLMPGGALVAPHGRTSIGWAPTALTQSSGQESERSESEKRRPEGEARNGPTPGSPTEPARRSADLDG